MFVGHTNPIQCIGSSVESFLFLQSSCNHGSGLAPLYNDPREPKYTMARDINHNYISPFYIGGGTEKFLGGPSKKYVIKPFQYY